MTAEQEAYYAALDLVAEIDEALKKGVHHYYDGTGNFLYSLDQVIQAILDDEWPPPRHNIAVGDWLWVKLPGGTEMIGRVIAFDRQSITIKNSHGGATVTEDQIAGRFSWNQLRPGDLVPEWLNETMSESTSP